MRGASANRDRNDRLSGKHNAKTVCSACAGFALQTSQLFAVDVTPPKITVSSFTASARRAAAVFTGVDASTVAFQCKLDRTPTTANTAAVPLAPTDPPEVLGQYQPCSSPVVSKTLLCIFEFQGTAILDTSMQRSVPLHAAVPPAIANCCQPHCPPLLPHTARSPTQPAGACCRQRPCWTAVASCCHVDDPWLWTLWKPTSCEFRCIRRCENGSYTLTIHVGMEAGNSRLSESSDQTSNPRPQVYASLPDGSYTLTIQAEDGAGNTNGSPVTRSWTVSMASYTQITAVDAAASRITFAAFKTVAGGGAPPGLQCRLQRQSDASDASVDSVAGYAACTSPQARHVVIPPECIMLASALELR